jgi:hypothetical protein
MSTSTERVLYAITSMNESSLIDITVWIRHDAGAEAGTTKKKKKNQTKQKSCKSKVNFLD